MRGQAIGAKNGRVVAVVGVPEDFRGTVKAKIVRNRHNIYLAKALL